MATKKEVKLVKKSEHTETKTQKAGSATFSVKVKSTEQEVEVKEELKPLTEESTRTDREEGEKKANLAYVNNKDELSVAVEDFIYEEEIYERLEQDYNWTEKDCNEYFITKDGKFQNIKWVYYVYTKGGYFVTKVDFIAKDERMAEILESDFILTEEELNIDKMLEKSAGVHDVIQGLIKDSEKGKWEERVRKGGNLDFYRKTKVRSGEHKGRTKYVVNALSPEGYKEWLEGAFGTGTTKGHLERLSELYGIDINDVKPYKYSAATGIQHHKPDSEKEREYNKAYNEAKKQERAENRKAANENLAFVKSQYKVIENIVKNQAYKQIQEIKRAKGYKFDVSALPLPPMPNIKLPQVQVTEWAGKEIFTPLLDPLTQKSKVVIKVEGDETGKKDFIRRPPDLSGLRNVKKEDYKISRNYFKAGCTLEFYPCLVAATYFQILVALTPIDEEYTYTKSEFHSNEKELIRNIRQMGRKINKKNMVQKYNELKQTYGNERNNYKGLTTQLQTWETKREIHHKIDNDIVRADWVLKFRGKEFKAFKSSRSGSYIEFEEDWFASYADQDSIYKIASVIYDNVKDLDDFSKDFDCINLNPRKDMLEYGGYNEPTIEEHGLLTRRIGTRYGFEHGVTHKGYVYQAPAGFERITEDYYIKCLQSNRGFATKFINTCTKDKYKGLQTKKQFMDENSKMFRRLKKLDPTLGAEFKPKGAE